ncbi:MAG TPA: excinuclease ABC subunit UvrB, partial [Bradyrhizobium sp.]|nr:excinuclease ABC subunit UvrB [Bradyrhizobium sp.]
MAKSPDRTRSQKPRAPKSKAHRPEVQPIGRALAELLNPAIPRGEAGIGSGTGLQPPPDNSKDRRAGGEAAMHRARKSTPKNFPESTADPYPMPLRPNPQPPGARSGFEEAPQANYGTSATIPALDPELARQLGFTTEEEDAAALARPPRNKMESLGVAATAEALENLIRDGRPEFRKEDGSLRVWTPHRPPR